MSGQIYVFSGPSGVGKSTIIKLLREKISDIVYSVSHTSRAPRDKEKDGVDYNFVERDTFEQMIKKGDFVEWAPVYQDLYGTSFSSLNYQTEQGLDVILDLDSHGAKNIKDHYRDSILIYILPPSLNILEKRLRDRATDNDDAISKRTKKASTELINCEWYDYIIINDNLQQAAEKAESIIRSDRCRTSRTLPRVKEIFTL